MTQTNEDHAKVERLLGDLGYDSPPSCVEVGGVGLGTRAAVVWWRRQYHAARTRALPMFQDLPEPFSRAVVHLEKSRDGFDAALAETWNRLPVGGKLWVVGPNALGAKSALKLAERRLGVAPAATGFGGKMRAARFEKTSATTLALPVDPTVSLEIGGKAVSYQTRPGVFSAKRVDKGSMVLIEHLATIEAPHRVLDLGAGCGTLSLAGAQLWPDAHFHLLEADHRAVLAAKQNMTSATAKIAATFSVEWADVEVDAIPQGFDLVVVNPPFHRGKARDLSIALRMFEVALGALSCDDPARGQVLIVANRDLPYEAPLKVLGEVAVVAENAAFKILSLRRRR